MAEYKFKLERILKKYEMANTYQKRIAGDINSFRYPHLQSLQNNFKFDNELQTFLIKDFEIQVFDQITINDITTYELLNKEAKKIHLSDMLGYKSMDQEKDYAYLSVKKNYDDNQVNGRWRYPIIIKKINMGSIQVRKEFQYLNNFIDKSRNCSVYFIQFMNVPYMFQFGSTLKGTNIVITDNNQSNFYQELFHIIYHLEEGIPGFNEDNLNIEEIWGNADALYLKQLVDGRMTRRLRKNNSPHDIKFLDYVFLRAYLGQAFNISNEKLCFHSVFSIIEPTIKLLFHCLGGDIEYKNKLIIDGICFDHTDSIKASFNKIFGPNSYEKVFYDFNLFNRLNTIQDLCAKNNINYDDILNVMFSNQSLVPTVIGSDVIRYIWMNSDINQDRDLIIDLVDNYSNIARQNNFIITLDKWKEYLHNNKKVKVIK